MKLADHGIDFHLLGEYEFIERFMQQVDHARVGLDQRALAHFENIHIRNDSAFGVEKVSIHAPAPSQSGLG